MAPRDPFANFERMRREMDELFGDVLDRAGMATRRGWTPRVDLFYCGDPPRAIVKVELAGVDPDAVAIELRGRQLLVAGERRADTQQDPLYQRMEIERGPFRRVVELGADVEADSARASFEDGVLRIEIPLVTGEAGVRQVPIGGRRGQGAADGEPGRQR